MKESHSYPGKAVNFVIGAKVVSGHFSANISEVSKDRLNWNAAYAADLDKRIDTIAATYMGVSTRNELFKVSLTLNTSIATMKNDLSTLKTNLDVDFKGSPDYVIMLTDLGFPKNGHLSFTQPELVALLTKFKATLTPEYLTKITAKGLNPDLPQRIADNAGLIIETNTRQEQLKGTVKEATGKMLSDLNALYKEIIGICKIAANHYKSDPVKKEMFTFSKVLSNLGDSRPAPKEEVTPAAEVQK